MRTKSFPASFVRGGTSNGLVIRRDVLPHDDTQWQPILSSAMGSPDQYGRQLNGMGSGLSSTSKICVVAKSVRHDADVDFTFVQVGIKDGSLDMAGNCGNMSSIVGPFAFDEGLIDPKNTSRDGKTTVTIFNTNTSKLVTSTFAVNPITKKYDSHGDYAIDGVPGTASCITLSFLNPSGAKTGKALPTGNSIDILTLADGQTIRATLSDIANPGVFVLASEVGVPSDIHPDTLNNNAGLMARLEEIRRAGTTLMGLDPDIQSVPKIVLISPPLLPPPSSSTPNESPIDIVCRALSMQQAHKAVPLTLALNLAATCRIPGTLPHQIVQGRDKQSFTIAHASGKLDVGSVLEDGKIKSALLHRTARVLMKGEVYYDVAED